VAELKLWNKLESGTSEVGVDGSVTGGTFVPAKYNNGFQIDAISEYIDFSIVPDEDYGAIELWFMPSFSSTDTTNRYIVDRSDVTTRVGFRWDSTSMFIVQHGGVTVSANPVSFLAGDLLHLAVVWDVDGIEGSADTLRFYYNGILLGSTTSVLSSLAQTDIRVGTDQANALYANGVIDNLKMYDYAKTDFSDRFWEGYSPVTEQQFDRLDKAPAVLESTSYLSGKEIEVPEPDHYWKLDEVSGDKVIDSGKNQINGINSRVAVNQDGSYLFDGTSGYINIAVSDIPIGAEARTTIAWIQASTISGYDTILSWGTASADQIWTMYSNAGDLILSMSGTSLTASSVISIDTWYHVAATYDGTTVRLYLDGVLIGTLVRTINTGSSDFHIGVYIDKSQEWFDGNIKNVSIYNQNLSLCQIKTIYEQEKAELIESDIPIPEHHYLLDSLAIADKGKGSLILPGHYYAMDETEQTVKALDGGIYPVIAAMNNTPVSEVGKYGKALHLNGTTQYVSAVSISIGKSFTVCVWVKADGTTWNDNAVIGSARAANGYVMNCGTGVTTFGAYVYNSSGGPIQTMVAQDIGFVNQWRHYAIVHDNDNDKTYHYVDGKLLYIYSGAIVRTVGTISPEIGKDSTFARYHDGLIDDYRLYDKVLSQQELIAAMNNTDTRRLAYGTLSATPPTLVYDSEIGECLSFNGTNNSIGCGNTWNFESNESFAVSGWFKMASPPVTTRDVIISNKLETGSPTRGWEVFVQHTSGNLRFSITGDTGTSIAVEPAVDVADDTWHSFYAEYDGSGKASGLLLYLDGVRLSQTIEADNLAGSIVDSASDASIGSNNNADFYWNGRLKDMRVWNK